MRSVLNVPIALILIAAVASCTPAPGSLSTRPAIYITSKPVGSVIVVDLDTVGRSPIAVRPDRRLVAGVLDEVLIRALPPGPGMCRQGYQIDLGQPAPDTVSFDMNQCPPASDSSHIYEPWEPDQQAERIGYPPLDYPDRLRAAGIEGDAVFECVIDANGRAEPLSIRVLISSDPLFSAAGRDAIVRSKYKPARLSGTPVRVRVHIPITWSIRR
jgi:TonB family protein